MNRVDTALRALASGGAAVRAVAVWAMLGFVMLGVAPSAAVAAVAAVAPAWSVQTTRNPLGAEGSVLSGVSCPSRQGCMAVGHFTNRSGVGLPLAERWDGRRWSIEPVPKPAGAKTVLLFDVSCVSRSMCVAVGAVTDHGGLTLPLAERWNGVRWALQRAAKPAGRATVSYLGGVSCTSRTVCLAVGYHGNSGGTAGVTLAERWNGAAWRVDRTPVPAGASVGFLSALSCSSSRACTAVGFYIDRAGAGKPLAERWNGMRWSLQRAPSQRAALITQLVGVSCARQGQCLAAGFFSIVTGIEIMLAERWNGMRWSLQQALYPAGATGVQFAGVSCISPSYCTTVGFFGEVTGYDQALAEQWNGSVWTIQRVPAPAGTLSNALESVSCTAITTCTAVGSSLNSRGIPVTFAERYG